MNLRPAALLPRVAVLAATVAACIVPLPPAEAALTFGNNPLYLVSGKANVLIILDNSNSMDEDETGKAVGSFSSESKSEMARGVIRTLTDTYLGRVNMGLMAYRQNTPDASNLHNSQYDVSYDPANYDPNFSGDRASAKKKYRIANPTSSGNYIHYNVALPFYSGSNMGTAFCYSPTAQPFADKATQDTYRCFKSKSGSSDTNLTRLGSGDSATSAEQALGYSVYRTTTTFNPTDSDYAQGISDFGKQMTWTYVGRTWSRNDSPGRGYLHVRIADLDSAQAAKIADKLRCNVPDGANGCQSATANSIYNAGLTPIEGTLLTAKDYFGGKWSTTSEGYVAGSFGTGGCYPLPTSCGKDYVILLTDGLPSTDQSGKVVSNPTTALSAAAAAAASLKTAGIETYVIGFALPYGTNPRSLDTIAASGGTTQAFDATNTTTLQAAFTEIFDDIARKSSAFGSLSQNTTAITANSRVYQARFSSVDWSGELRAIQPAADGTLTTIWSTSQSGKIPAPADRKIYTLKPGTGGIEFKNYADLDATQQGHLSGSACSGALTGANCGQARIDWLRGVRSREQTSGPLRKRAVLLGDIVSSSPYYAADTKTLYVGANDGMLHAFDATTGVERFAYVPNAVMSKLAALTNPSYAHDYLVDGEIAVSTEAETPGRRILVGSLGRGGKALYALDVTAPGSFGESKVLWEFTATDLGLVLGTPMIVKLNNGRPAVVVGNGYNSANERAVLLVIDLETGALIKTIDTRSGSSSSSNGLSSPRGWDSNGDGKVDLVFAGDRLGNLWKFDLSASSASSWGSAYTSGTTPAPMFIAKDASGNRQPITGGISLGIDTRKGDPNFGKLFVFFGTGQYMLSGDVSTTAVQTQYGIVDTGAAISGRSELRQRTIVVATTLGSNSVRAFSAAVSGDMSGRKGWYVDWVPPSGSAVGERVISTPRFIGSVLWVSSIIPSSDTCQPGGTGYLNVIDPFSGGSLTTAFIDGDGDGDVDSADSVAAPGGSGTLIVGSVSLNNGLVSEAVLMDTRIMASGSSGEVKTVGAANPLRSGRIAWREIVRP